jgi:hypothetical protein
VSLSASSSGRNSASTNSTRGRESARIRAISGPANWKLTVATTSPPSWPAASTSPKGMLLRPQQGNPLLVAQPGAGERGHQRGRAL